MTKMTIHVDRNNTQGRENIEKSNVFLFLWAVYKHMDSFNCRLPYGLIILCFMQTMDNFFFIEADQSELPLKMVTETSRL
jgi:hypothetical protein